MPSMLTVILFLCASAGSLADDISGPNHLAKLFPMREIFEWNHWKPITGPSFDPHAR